MSESNGLHNLLICCGPIAPGGTPGCCEGRYRTCWCGGAVGLREPGDAAGLGCLADITHNWTAGPVTDTTRNQP